MDKSLFSLLLPSALTDHFELVGYKELGNVETKKMELELYLDEKNVPPPAPDKSEYESKGFLPATRVQDFPIRGKAVYLVLRRRRWRHKESRKEVTNDYNFIAEGARITEELSAFLKGTGREPGRYH